MKPITSLRRPSRLSVALSIPLWLAACAVGPDYRRPELDLPATPAVEAAAASASSVASRPAAGTWWRHYQDEALNRLVEEALAANQDLAAAVARVNEARAVAGLATSDQLPSVYAQASSERSRNSEAANRNGPGQPLESTNHRATLNVSWEIDFWGRYRRASEAARADFAAVESNRDAVRLLVAADVTRGYFNLVALDARIAATRQAVARGEEALAMQKKRFEAGVISEFDFQQRSAEVDAGRAQLPPLLSQRGAQERALGVLLGRSPRQILEARVERAAALVPVNAVAAPAALPSDLLLRRPDLVEAEQRLAAANARIGVARAAYFPSITLTGLLGGESSALGDLFSGPARIWNFAGSLTQPLWGASRVGKQVDAAEARNEQALAIYRSAIANAFREVQDALQAQGAAREVYEIEQRRVTSLAKSWDLAKLRYTNGIASQLDVIDAERNLLLAELNRIEAERALRSAVADLYRALGG